MRKTASVLNGLKTLLRDQLPPKFQVPLKYYYGWLQGTLEEEMKLLGLLVRGRNRVIDVGGNRGVYAFQFWKLGVRVEVFEPNPACSAVLSAWAADKPTVQVHSVALSSREGSANLHIPIDGAGTEHDASASIEDTGFTKARDQLVQLQTLDSFRFEGVCLIKIDVEGHEYGVLDGSVETIQKSKPALLVEIEQRHLNRPIDEVFRRVLGFGYQGYFMHLGRLTPLDRFEVSVHQSMANFNNPKGDYINNFLFLHHERISAGEYGALLNQVPR